MLLRSDLEGAMKAANRFDPRGRGNPFGQVSVPKEVVAVKTAGDAEESV